MLDTATHVISLNPNEDFVASYPHFIANGDIEDKGLMVTFPVSHRAEIQNYSDFLKLLLL